MAGISARCLPEKIVKPVANTSGTMAPPVKPWIARKAIMEPMLHDRPHIRLEIVNIAADATNSQRVDMAPAR